VTFAHFGTTAGTSSAALDRHASSRAPRHHRGSRVSLVQHGRQVDVRSPASFGRRRSLLGLRPLASTRKRYSVTAGARRYRNRPKLHRRAPRRRTRSHRRARCVVTSPSLWRRSTPRSMSSNIEPAG